MYLHNLALFFAFILENVYIRRICQPPSSYCSHCVKTTFDVGKNSPREKQEHSFIRRNELQKSKFSIFQLCNARPKRLTAILKHTNRYFALYLIKYLCAR